MSSRILLAIAVVAAIAIYARNATPSASAQIYSAPVEGLLNADGTLNMNTGYSGALDLRGWNVTLDSKRGPVLAPQGQSPAIPQSLVWSALPDNGLNDSVYALAVSGSDLYVGGVFTQTIDGAVTNLNNIAKFSGSAWSALPHNGLNNQVNTLAVSGTDLYVGGDFTQTADGTVTNLNRIAKFSSGAWSALPHNGLNGNVYTLAVSSSDLYVGGFFTQTADGVVANLNKIAKLSGGVWSALPNNGLTGTFPFVSALGVSGSDLYIGGFFTQTADGAVTNLNNIAKFCTTCNSGLGSWSALPHNGLDDTVRALAVSGTDLYVGGFFMQTADGAVTNLNRIAKFSGGVWSALPNNGLDSNVWALAVNGSDLYVGGDFKQTSDSAVTNLNRIAKLGLSGSVGPVAYLKFDEGSGTTALDSTGNNYTGTLSSGVSYTITTAPIITTTNPFAAQFDGSTGIITMTGTAPLTFTQAATYDAWIYLNQLPSDAGHSMQVITKDGVGTDLGVLVKTDNHIVFYYGSGTALSSTTVVRTNCWYRVTSTYQANTQMALYVNGALQSSLAIGFTRTDSGYPISIGEGIANTGKFNGVIDDVRVYQGVAPPAGLNAACLKIYLPLIVR